jgi:hypothetical protein
VLRQVNVTDTCAGSDRYVQLPTVRNGEAQSLREEGRGAWCRDSVRCQIPEKWWIQTCVGHVLGRHPKLELADYVSGLGS